MIIKIGVDNGNKNTKTAHFVFNTGVATYDEKPEITNEWLKYNGIYYCLSQERISYTKDKTTDPRFFLLTLFGIAKELVARNVTEKRVEVVLGVGLPPEHMSLLKTAYIGYFKRQGIWIEYAGMEYCIDIVDVKVYPQGYAAAVKHLNDNQRLLRFPKLYLMDIGGRTVDIIELNEGRINVATCQSREDGVNAIYGAVKREMRQHDVQISENEIDSIINNELEGVFLPASFIERIKSTVEVHVEKLLLSINEDGIVHLAIRRSMNYQRILP